MRRKEAGRTAILLMLAAVIASLCVLSSSCTPGTEPGTDGGELPRYIIHGAGRLTGTGYYGNIRTFAVSNSREGLEECAKRGCRFIEMDFSFTSDGALVCLHNWSHYYSDDIVTGVPLSYEEFMATRIFRLFTPASLGDVVGFLEENEGVSIITYTKERNADVLRYIAERYPEMLDRFIPQIYSTEEYDAVRAMGFGRIILTLYGLPWEEKTDTDAISAFAMSHPLFGITFPKELCEIDGYVDGLLRAGTPLFVHTVNGGEEQSSFFDMGITAVYTDEIK